MGLNVVIGPLCVLLGIFIALYVKDKAREVAKQEFADQIKSVLATFKEELVSKLDGTYSRATELKLMLESRDDRLDILDKRIEFLEEAFQNVLTKKENC